MTVRIANRESPDQTASIYVIRAGIHKMLVRKANREYPDQTASSEAVCSGSALFFLTCFDRQLESEILSKAISYCMLLVDSLELNHCL